VFRQEKIQRIQIWRAWRPCSGSSSTYPLVMIGVIENILHSTAEMCRNAITRVDYSFSYNSQIQCFRTHADMEFIFLFYQTKQEKMSTSACIYIYIHIHVCVCVCVHNDRRQSIFSVALESFMKATVPISR
jgi:hypothetical protein